MFLFFEISDKVVPEAALYAVYGIFGMIGFALAYWRWWAGAIWMIFPLGFSVAALGMFQATEFSELDIQRQLGGSYLLHNVVAPSVGLILNLFGMILGYTKASKLRVSE